MGRGQVLRRPGLNTRPARDRQGDLQKEDHRVLEGWLTIHS